MSNAYILTMTEQQLTDTVVELAKFHGWKVVHFLPAKLRGKWRTPVQGDIGSPDLLLARRGVVLLVELKTEKGRVMPAQNEWAAAIGAIYRLWRPSDMTEIRAVLA
jgi:hypothetical protein